jgi:hypothetical protein
MTTESSSNPTPLVQFRSRPPPPPFSTFFFKPRRVTFHHPAYESSRLLQLAALDGDPPHGGIHHETALLICGIITDNVWDGWFTESRDGPKLELDKDVVLTGSDYFYHLPWPESQAVEEGSTRGPYKYPVIPSFRQWPFPHSSPPSGWDFASDTSDIDITQPVLPPPSVSSISQAIRDRDRSCRLSGYQDQIECAYLCPRSELPWFRQQEMERYNTRQSMAGAALVDDLANALTLRSDIQTEFDRGTFVFTRKRGAWVSHFLDSTCHLGAGHHNVDVEIPSGVHQAFLLARVAWAVFPLVSNFLLRGDKRLVRLRGQFARTREDKELTPQTLSKIVPEISARSRSRSPPKRLREEENEENEDSHDVTATKRRRLEGDDQEVKEAGSLATTPDLVKLGTSSGVSQLPSSDTEDVNLDEGIGEADRIAALRRDALFAQRKIDAHLMCCDYTAAETAIAAGADGPKKFGGAHLCPQCRGADYMADGV